MIELPTLLARHRRPLLAVLVLLWLAAATASHVPVSRLPSLEVSDKTEHVVGFLALAGMFILTLTAYGFRRPQRVLATILVLPLYAALDEWTQPWFGRGCELNDWFADLCGTAGAIIAWEVLYTSWRRLAGNK